MVDGADDRLLGGLYGLLVGDAVGVPYEFHSSATLPAWDAIEIVPPVGFRRAHVRAPKCAWSDDGAQALCLLDSLLQCRALDLDDLGQRFLRWKDEGYLAVDGVVRIRTNVSSNAQFLWATTRTRRPPSRAVSPACATVSRAFPAVGSTR